MRIDIARWAGHAGLAAVIAASAACGSTEAARFAPAAAAAPFADVTPREIAQSNAKVRMAYDALVGMWSDDLAERGARFVPPGLVRYRGAVRTPCGVMSGNNAAYCTARNTIYFDEIFVARQAKEAALDLGTDGDMAAVGIIAHEMGHAVAMQLGVDSPVPYYNEAAADCLAGAFTSRSALDGTLEAGDLDEAFHGLAASGDPTPQLTGNRRLDARITYRAALLGHGTRDQRLANFTAGYEGGADVCLAGMEGG
ncbi:MAG TPA: neutral zinc metallopeptidase [Gemmatimonadaceae bacterium]|nr:neutral zinc metallopeptidase [Gemmatimonadaceae bacterium]